MEIGNKKTKLNLKFRVIFAVGTGVSYTLMLWLFDYFSDANLYSTGNLIFQGVAFGILFGIGFPYFNQKLAGKLSNKVGMKIKSNLETEEVIEIEGPANLFRGIEGVGGKIFLTNKKLIFISHNINFQKGQSNIYYADIQEIIKRKTAKLIDNAIRIKTAKGNQYDFVVNERDLWFEKIMERLNKKTQYNKG